MAKRGNPRACQLSRGFLLGQLHAKGHTLTTARIRKLGVSKATAKRDMRAIRKLVPAVSSKPVIGMRNYVAQRTKAAPEYVGD